jgi:hypothetical protein
MLCKVIAFSISLRPQAFPLFWFVWCVVSVILIFWLLYRVNSQCQLSLISSEVLSEMFLLWFLIWLFNFIADSFIYVYFRRPIHLPFSSYFLFFLNLFLDFPWVFQIYSLRSIVWCCASSCLLCLYYFIELCNSLFDFFLYFERDV